MRIVDYGSESIVVEFEQKISLKIHTQVRKLYQYLTTKQIKGSRSIIPAYTSVTISFDSSLITKEEIKDIIWLVDFSTIELAEGKKHSISVCYHESLAPDLEEVLQHTGLSHDALVELHSSTSYLVYMLGFVPGFLYLGGLDQKLHIPRRETPRIKIPQGSVGLAGEQTGVYPLETPGGWQLIGRTPLTLFDSKHPEKIKMGDFISFDPISLEEYYQKVSH